MSRSVRVLLRGRSIPSLTIACSMLLVLTCTVVADTTGIIAGIVSDPSGEPLPGASVMISGSEFGSMTDSRGEYAIAGLSPGEYTVTARMMGRSTSSAEGVIVIAGQMSRIDFSLMQDTTGSTVIRVIESRSHILQDVPTTLHLLDLSETSILQSGRLIDAIAGQPGIVVHGGEMHVRGGRAGEVDYLLDGISMRSPMDNRFSMELPLGAISNAAMMTGGLSVEYGNAMSGIVNLIGEEGGSSYSGSLTARYGDITARTIDSGQLVFLEKSDVEQCRRGYTGVEGSVSGPEPITGILLPALGVNIPGDLRISASGQVAVSGRDTLDTRGAWENNWQTDASGLVKLTYRPVNTMSFALDVLGSYRELGWNEWAWSRYHLPAYIDTTTYLGRSQDNALPVRFSETSGMTLNATRLLGSETTVKLTMGLMKFQNWHRIRSLDGGWVGEGTNPIYWLTQYAPEDRVSDSMGFYHTGVHPNVWLDSKASVSTAMLEFDHNPGPRSRIKAGISGIYYDLYQYNVYALSYGNTYLTRWSAFPHSGAAYAQGSYRFPGGVILTGGARAELFDANTSIFSPEESESIPVETKWQVSPRIGLSVPFSDRSVFFTTYGHYFQMPPMYCLYLESSYNLAEGRVVTGNPDLDPESTRLFEVGVRHLVDNSTEFSIAAYYKDIAGLVSTEDHYEGTYYVFTNDDSHGMVRGIEATLSRRAGGNFSGQLSYGLSVAKGRYSSMLARYNYAQSGVVYISREENYLDWDQTHTASASMQYRTLHSEGPELAGIHPLENTALGLSWSFGSGLPYTLPPSEEELVETNTERYPFSMQTDLTLSRTFDIGRTDLNLMLGVFNLFNRKNIIQIYDTALYRSTEDPTGEMGNPRAWSSARHFLLSAVLSW